MARSHGPPAAIYGTKKPAMSVSWDDEAETKFWIVFMADFDPAGDPESQPEAQLVCTGCLLEDGDTQLGEGLDLACEYDLVEWDAADEEWFIPADADEILSGV